MTKNAVLNKTGRIGPKCTGAMTVPTNSLKKVTAAGSTRTPMTGPNTGSAVKSMSSGMKSSTGMHTTASLTGITTDTTNAIPHGNGRNGASPGGTMTVITNSLERVIAAEFTRTT